MEKKNFISSFLVSWNFSREPKGSNLKDLTDAQEKEREREKKNWIFERDDVNGFQAWPLTSFFYVCALLYRV